MTTIQSHAVAAPARAAAPRERLLARLPVTERTLTLVQIFTTLLEGGGGPPIILLHGPGEHAVKWVRVIPALSRRYRVIAPDLPGHGDSGPVTGDFSVDRAVDWLGALIDQTCPTPPVLVGQIVGGALAAAFAARHGDRLRGLVLVDSLGLAPFQPAPAFGQALGHFLQHPTGATHDQLWRQCAFDLDTLRRGMGDVWTDIAAYNLDRAQSPDTNGTRQGLMESLGLPALPRTDLERIAVPTTLVWGRHDLATPLAVAQETAARLDWPLQVIEDAADDPPIEQPEAFLDALNAFLDGLQPPPDTRAAWDRVAPGFDRTNTPSQMRIAGEGLARAGLRAGMHLLDVAAGSGALSLPAARLGASVTAIDQSPVMLELLGARATSEGLSVTRHVMDGHDLEFPDGRFDIAASQFGVMLFPDMPRALREMARVTKPGGKVLILAYGDPPRIEFLHWFVEAIHAVRPEFTGLPMDPPPLELQLAVPGRLHAALAAVGLEDVRVETVTEVTEFATGTDLWEWIRWSNPIVDRVLAPLALSADEERAIPDVLERMVRGRGGPDPAALTNPVNVGVGTAHA